MNGFSFAHIVQLIASAVNLKLSYTLSQRIAQMGNLVRQAAGPAWIDRTSAGRSITDRKLAATNKAILSAATEESTARQAAQHAAQEWLRESLNPTGRDLEELAAAAEHYRKKLEEASASLEALRYEQDRIKAASVGRSYTTRLDNLEDARQTLTAYRDDTQQKWTSVTRAVQEEHDSPTGMDPMVLAGLETQAQYLRLSLANADQSLTSLSAEQDYLRAAMDRHLKIREAISVEDAKLLANSAHRVNKLASARDSAQHRFSAGVAAVQEEMIRPSGKTDREIETMGRHVLRYQQELEHATLALRESAKNHESLSKSVERRARAEQSHKERRSGSKISERIRRVVATVERRAGPKLRKQFRGVFQRARGYTDAFFRPQVVLKRHKLQQTRVIDAKSAYRAARSTFRSAVAAYHKSPTSQKGAIVQKAAQGAAAAGRTVAAAEAAAAAGSSMSRVATVMALVAQGAMVLSSALGPVGTAIGALVAVAVTAVAVAVKAISATLAAGQAEIERYRRTRSRFSSQVTSAVMRYDIQSMNLESRSTAATSASAAAVTDATMRLRETVQKKTQAWEDIMNRILIVLIDSANLAAKVLEKVDFLTPAVKGALDLKDFVAKLLGIGNAIEKNTRPVNDNVGVAMLQMFDQGNREARDKKSFPKPLPRVQ